MKLIKNDIAAWSATSEIIAVFHTNAWHVTLHDTAYNPDRNIAAGNPYKIVISDLQKRGVKIELCGATAKANGWGNEDRPPDIKINTDAIARTTQLVQRGFVKITELVRFAQCGVMPGNGSPEALTNAALSTHDYRKGELANDHDHHKGQHRDLL